MSTSQSVDDQKIELSGMSNSTSPSAPLLREAKGDTHDINVPAPEADSLLETKADGEKIKGIERLSDDPGKREDLWEALKRMNLLYSTSHGSSCCGRIVDADQIGVVHRQGAILFTKPGQYTLWDPLTNWAGPPVHPISQPVIKAQDVTIVTLTQREVAVARDGTGKTLLLKQGRYVLQKPAVLEPQKEESPIISLVNLQRNVQVDRFSFFNVPQGEVAGITLPNGQIRILLPGVHIVEDAKFERFLPTVPIQSKLRKDVITSDQVSVALEVDITTQLVDCARFLKMSAGHGGDKGGCKDLYDAIEESAQSVFIDMFSKYKYYEGRTRQGEEESKFEDQALHSLDREAAKYGGRVFKVNILKYRADAVEAAYAQHNKQQVELEHKKLSQARQFDILDAEQKHKQQMAERDEKAQTQKQGLQQEREIGSKQHGLKLALEDAKAREIKADLEAKAEGDRKKTQAQVEAEAAKVKMQGAADAQGSKIRTIAEAEARSEELKSNAKVAAVEALAKALANNKELLEMERLKQYEELQVQKLLSITKNGGRIVPVELLRMSDLADERALKRLENTPMLQVFGNQTGLPLTGSEDDTGNSLGVPDDYKEYNSTGAATNGAKTEKKKGR
jgi:hypothetical protein